MSKESVLIAQMLAKAARADARLWRNATARYWTGQVKGRTTDGHLILAHPVQVRSGLCVGSSDLVGISNGGLFTGLEVKTPGDRIKPHQTRWLEVIRQLGGIAAEVRTPDDVVAILDGRY